MKLLPKGRPPSEPHSWSYIAVGVIQGLLLTATLFLMIL